MTEVGISARAAANVFIAVGGLSLIGRIFIGSASDRIGLRASIIGCFVLTTLALAWLLFAGELWAFYLFAMVFGFAYGGIVALQSPLAADLFGLKAHGTILGINATTVAVGHAIGPLMAGWIFDISGSYFIAFVIILACSVIGLLFAITLKPSGTAAAKP